jgi:adenosylhomocysteine nucleosidase
MPKVAIVAALEREVGGLTRTWSRVEQEYEGRKFVFFERDDIVVVCGGIGMDAARRAAQAVIALYRPIIVHSVGFAGALDAALQVGDLFAPAVVIDARDGSRVQIEVGDRKGVLVTFMAVAGAEQKRNLAQAYGAHAVDMEAAAVAAAARAHGIDFVATKVISDDLHFEMPQMGRFIDPQGRFRTANFALFVASRPWLWWRVATLAGNSRKAAKALGGHLERLRQELRQPPQGIVAPPAAPQTVAASGLRTGSHE